MTDESLLQEAKLEEIFCSDPLTRSDAEWMQCVKYLRNLRETWQKSNLTATPKGKSAPKTPKAAPDEITLADLGL